jgi:hypothetical protein
MSRKTKMTPAPHPFDRATFLMYNQTQLFTASQVADMIESVVASHSAAQSSDEVLEELIIHFKGFEDQKTFKYSAGDIIQYLENFKKLAELRQQTKEHP